MVLGAAGHEEEKRRRYLMALGQIAGTGQQVAGSLDQLGAVQRQEAARAEAKAQREAEMVQQSNRDAESFRDRDFNRQAQLRDEAHRAERDKVADERAGAAEARAVNEAGHRFRQADIEHQGRLREAGARRRREAQGIIDTTVEAHAREVLEAEGGDPEDGTGIDINDMAAKVARESQGTDSPLTDEQARDKLLNAIARQRDLAKQETQRAASAKARDDYYGARGKAALRPRPTAASKPGANPDLRELSRIRADEERNQRALVGQRNRLLAQKSVIETRAAANAGRFGGEDEARLQGIEDALAQIDDELRDIGDPSDNFASRSARIGAGQPLTKALERDTIGPPPPEEEAPAVEEQAPAPAAPPQRSFLDRILGRGPKQGAEIGAMPFEQAQQLYGKMSPEQKAQVDAIGQRLMVERGMGKKEALTAAMNQIAGRV